MDAGHVYADEMLDVIAKQIAQELGKANKRAIENIKKYLKRHEEQIKEKTKQVDEGEITEKDFERWAISEVTTGEEWTEVRNTVADEMSKATENVIKGTGVILMAVYLYNRKYMNDAIESTVKVKFPKIKKRKPIVPKSPDPKKNRIWHRRKIESVIRQGMKKGHSVDEMAKRMEQVTAMDMKSAYRTVRTGVTSAEAQARIDSFLDAEDLGIDMMKQWVAVKDSRTRTSHRIIDGEKRHVLETFSNGLLAPATPPDGEDGDPAEIYNCRCALIGEADGHEISFPKAPEGQTRTEWIGEKPIPRHYKESKKDYEKRVARIREGKQ